MKVLIIRFSSFGDIFQALEAASHIQAADPSAKISWLVREDFAALLKNQDFISHLIPFHRKNSVLKLIQLSWALAPQFTHIYDAHNNLRSLIVRLTIRVHWLVMGRLKPSKIIVRSKNRLKRFLYFKMRRKVFPEPFIGAESFITPLKMWFPGLHPQFDKISWAPHILANSKIIEDYLAWKKQSTGKVIALAPSAAWPNKRWPIEQWPLLTNLLIKNEASIRFLLLGGPEDHFIQQIADSLGPKQSFNAVGKSNLLESATLLDFVDALISNDTGLLHVADRLQKPLVAIIGPTAFGYPANPHAQVAEVPNSELSCKPCSKDGRDPCTNPEYLKCLKLVSPEFVAKKLDLALKGTSL